MTGYAFINSLFIWLLFLFLVSWFYSKFNMINKKFTEHVKQSFYNIQNLRGRTSFTPQASVTVVSVFMINSFQKLWFRVNCVSYFCRETASSTLILKLKKLLVAKLHRSNSKRGGFCLYCLLRTRIMRIKSYAVGAEFVFIQISILSQLYRSK